jgi:hypothetical protein
MAGKNLRLTDTLTSLQYTNHFNKTKTSPEEQKPSIEILNTTNQSTPTKTNQSDARCANAIKHI